MLKLSKMTDYAVVVLADMARQKGQTLSATNIASNTALPEPTVSKVLKLLARRDLLESVRGSSGGYVLHRQPQDISMAQVIAATDGPVELTACVDNSQKCCAHADHCTIKGQWNPVNQAMTAALEGVSLEQMIGGVS